MVGIDKVHLLGYIIGMNKKKLGRLLFSLPFVMLGLSVIFRILYNVQDLQCIYFGDWLKPFLEILSSLGIYLAFGFFFIFTLLLGLGLYLMIKYRDRKNLSIKEVFVKSLKELSSKIKKKNIIKIILITLAILTFSFVFHLFLLSRVLNYLPYGVQDNPIQYNRIEKVKKDLLMVIPDKYEIIESKNEEPSEENDGCVYIYTIYPKEYSEIEKKYLDEAGLMYCEDIDKAILRGQVDRVKYNQTEGKWLYEDTEPLETKQYRDNLVSTVALGGSHALSDFHIVRLKNSDELIILSVPSSNRIRCETYDENGVETMKEDCVNFRDSLSPVYGDWVPQEIYEDYYNDLLEILNNI